MDKMTCQEARKWIRGFESRLDVLILASSSEQLAAVSELRGVWDRTEVYGLERERLGVQFILVLRKYNDALLKVEDRFIGEDHVALFEFQPTSLGMAPPVANVPGMRSKLGRIEHQIKLCCSHGCKEPGFPCQAVERAARSAKGEG